MGGSHDVLGVAPIQSLNKLDASPAFIIEKNREPGHWGCRVAGLFLAAGTKQNLVERHLLPQKLQWPTRNPLAGASGWIKAGCAACSAQSWNPRAGASGWKG